jgi:hypothetical protein
MSTPDWRAVLGLARPVWPLAHGGQPLLPVDMGRNMGLCILAAGYCWRTGVGWLVGETCPAGQVSQGWYLSHTASGQPAISVNFAARSCQPCTLRPRCTRGQARSLTLRPRPQHEALQAARQRQTTEAFKTTYRIRAGIEGTIAQAVRVTGLRQARYRGLAKTHLQHLALAAALNVLRALAWLNEVPVAATRPWAMSAQLLSNGSMPTKSRLSGETGQGHARERGLRGEGQIRRESS